MDEVPEISSMGLLGGSHDLSFKFLPTIGKINKLQTSKVILFDLPEKHDITHDASMGLVWYIYLHGFLGVPPNHPF